MKHRARVRFCQVSSLHPSNDYKTVSVYAQLPCERGSAFWLCLVADFFWLVRAFWLESGDDTGDL